MKSLTPNFAIRKAGKNESVSFWTLKDFQSGTLNGFVHLKNLDGISYIGEMVNSLPQGKGKLSLLDGVAMEGIWKKGMLIEGKIELPPVFSDAESFTLRKERPGFLELNFRNGAFKLFTSSETHDLKKGKIRVEMGLKGVSSFRIEVEMEDPGSSCGQIYTLSQNISFRKRISLKSASYCFEFNPLFETKYRFSFRGFFRLCILYPGGEVFFSDFHKECSPEKEIVLSGVLFSKLSESKSARVLKLVEEYHTVFGVVGKINNDKQEDPEKPFVNEIKLLLSENMKSFHTYILQEFYQFVSPRVDWESFESSRHFEALAEKKNLNDESLFFDHRLTGIRIDWNLNQIDKLKNLYSST